MQWWKWFGCDLSADKLEWAGQELGSMKQLCFCLVSGINQRPLGYMKLPTEALDGGMFSLVQNFEITFIPAYNISFWEVFEDPPPRLPLGALSTCLAQRVL